MDLSVRAIEDGITVEGNCGANFAFNGVPIGLSTPCDGGFVNLEATNITVTGTLDGTGASIVGTGIVPIGGVIMFNAAFSTIPVNWQLCDGTNGTPDMTDQFVYGTNNEGELLDAGGDADAVVALHSHTTQNDGNHSHTFVAQQNIGGFTDNGGAPDQRSTSQNTNTANAGNHNHTVNDAGEDPTDKNLPPFIKLAFIQRMS